MMTQSMKKPGDSEFRIQNSEGKRQRGWEGTLEGKG